MLVGAGASVRLGLASLDDIFEQPFRFSEKIESLEPDLEVIRSVRESIPPSDDRGATLEEVIGRLIEYIHLGDLLATDWFLSARIGRKIAAELNSFRDICLKALDRCYLLLLDQYGPQRIDPKSESVNDIVNIYKTCAALNINKSVHVFTTNYDCSFQMIGAHRKDIAFYSRINPASLSFDGKWHVACEKIPRSVPSAYVHRLHGCIAWFRDDNTAYNTWEHIGAANANQIRQSNSDLRKMLIKLTPSGQIPTIPSLMDAFNSFEEQLHSTNNLLVWGFSFRDIETLRIINSVCMNTPSFRVYYIDPYLDESTAYMRITRRLCKIPGCKIAPTFKPIRIQWERDYSYTKLSDVIRRTLP